MCHRCRFGLGYQLLRWEDPMYTAAALAGSLAFVSLLAHQSPLVVMLAISTLSLAMGLIGFRLWEVLVEVVRLRESADHSR
jgi:hypothetical protein